MHQLPFVLVAHALKPTFQNRLSRFLGIAKTGKNEDAQLVSETNSQAPSQTLCRTPNPVKLVRKKPSRNLSVNISAQLISESSTGCNESATQQPPVPEAQENRAVKELLVNAFQAAFASLPSFPFLLSSC
jgi:hypothetical protein